MFRPVTMLIATALITTPALANPSLSDADRAALEELKNSNDAAWNRRDHKTISGQYVAEATVQVAPEAPLIQGQNAIADFFASSFARRDGEYRHVSTLAHLDPIDDAKVLSDGDVRVEKLERDGSWTLVRRFRTITLAVKEGGGWKLRSVRAIPRS